MSANPSLPPGPPAVPASALPPLPRDQRAIDSAHLNLLSLFHFISMGLSGLGLLFLLGHFALFHAIFANPKFWQNQKGGPPPAELFAVLKWFYLVFAVWFFVSGILNLLSGLAIRARKRHTFSTIVAALNCLHIPLGTVLGVFTIVVLFRDSVRELYDAASKSGGPSPP